ncbi:hypothetical protein ACFQ3B_01020 [Stackebrandtia endophytica]|uniref:hypothetical protein n=1 Tax=Stackebrandtia endophytica TaxID=1496996 RepID=UPI001FE6239F|nr:hypothetical protein [Stackebrandtia endophytica]
MRVHIVLFNVSSGHYGRCFVGGGACQFGVDVLVRVPRERRRGMSAFFFDDGDVGSGGEHETGRAVPGVVEPDRWQRHRQGHVDGAFGDLMSLHDPFHAPVVVEEPFPDRGMPRQEAFELLRYPPRIQGRTRRVGEQAP